LMTYKGLDLVLKIQVHRQLAVAEVRLVPVDYVFHPY
jgi:hypothetical protein